MKKPKPLIERLNQRILKQLQTRKITNREAADQLGVSETYLSRTVAAIQTKEPGKSVELRKANAELAKIRKTFRIKLAKEVLKGRKLHDDAATEAGCSVRTIFRYVERYRPAK